MHELAITRALLDVALSHAARADARQVKSLRVVVGELSSAVDECVRFYWDEVARDTPCEGARLEFVRVPARFACLACGEEFGLSDGLAVCPRCGAARARVVAGDALYLEAIDVETAPTPTEVPA